MRVGIVRYPGSNCDFDALKYFDNSFFIWHKQEYHEGLLADVSLLVIPGGFAFGDRMYEKATNKYTISPGTMAVNSNVTSVIMKAHEMKIPILGICNGFQILTQLGLLPGKLVLNKNKQFNCKKVACNFHFMDIKSQPVLYIANSYGSYIMYEADMMYDYEVFLRYVRDNELGSLFNIAGVTNKQHNVFGMMPHPERNNDEFKYDLLKMLYHQRKNTLLFTTFDFQKNIEILMRSEHISYKSTKKYLRQLHTQEPWVIQGPGENAGIIELDDTYCLALRIESHNHPTFIDPFEGAATGVGGIIRDIIAMGARPIGLLDFLRFGTDAHSNHLLSEAMKGISYYGNCIGIPNIGGSLHRHMSYNKNPLVNVACLGLVKKDEIIYGNVVNEGSLLIYVGGRTGNDGIHGASMASKEFRDVNIDEMKSNIQKSDPFLEKLLLEACVEMAQLKLAEGMQDMGAGGLLCASYELISRGINKTGKNLGCIIDINKVPTKYEMDPCDIMISESQERMLIVCEQKDQDKLFELFDKWDLESAVIGSVNSSGIYKIVNDKTETLYQTEMNTFADVTEHWLENKMDNSAHDLVKASSKHMWEIYDSSVGNRTIKGPNEAGSYSILDINEANIQLLCTWGRDFDECMFYVQKFNATGLCMVNCMNYGHPNKTMGDFSQFIKEISKKCKEHHIPMVGGNVSLYNETDNRSIIPSPILFMVSKL
jgi:phosphoribosylformylglycinamidine (FGAM) synthase-like amidotransferase family enzyme/selenophosphate synthetase-related protein